MQQSRINNMVRDQNRLYLIDYKTEYKRNALKHIFFMLNTIDTSNTLKVQMKIENGSEHVDISCNCKDYIFRCRKNNMICKHCIFIVTRGLRLGMDRVINKQITFDDFTNNLHHITITNRDTLPQTIPSSRPSSIPSTSQVQQPEKINPDSELFRDMFLSHTREITDETLCPICIENIGTEEILSCPTCKQYVHYTCMKTWMSYGSNNSCMYCRSEMWQLANL